MTAATELIQVDKVIIAENGEKVLEREAMLKASYEQQIETIALLQEARETIERQGKELVTLNNSLVKRDEEIDRLNKSALESSVVYEMIKSRNTILTEFVRTWLQIFESKFESDKNHEVTEASDYLTQAIWMRDNAGRRDFHSIRMVQEWYDNQPAWKNNSAHSFTEGSEI
jgi:hypothetical protein